MFCRCLNRYGDAPNTNVCSICLAHPGMLPVPNGEAVDQALRVGLALGCRIPGHSKWDRKNYFYPDSPEGVPDLPVRPAAVRRGATFLDVGDHARAHLEEDAAKTIHVGGGGGRIAGSDGLDRRLQPLPARRCSRSSPSPTSATARRPAAS